MTDPNEALSDVPTVEPEAGLTSGNSRSPRRFITAAEAAALLDMTEQAFFLSRMRNNGPEPVFRPEGSRFIAEQIEYLAALPWWRRHFAISHSRNRLFFRTTQSS